MVDQHEEEALQLVDLRRFHILVERPANERGRPRRRVAHEGEDDLATDLPPHPREDGTFRHRCPPENARTWAAQGGSARLDSSARLVRTSIFPSVRLPLAKAA